VEDDLRDHRDLGKARRDAYRKQLGMTPL
jgi:hypothetical protein